MRATALLVSVLLSTTLLAAAVVPAQDAPVDATTGTLSFADVTYEILTLEADGETGGRTFQQGTNGTLIVRLASASFEAAPPEETEEQPSENGNNTSDGDTQDGSDGDTQDEEAQPEDEEETPRELALQVGVRDLEGWVFASEPVEEVVLVLDGEDSAEVSFPFTVNDDAPVGPVAFDVTFTDTETGDVDAASHAVSVVQPPAPPEPVSPVIVAAGAVLAVLVVGGGAYTLVKRRRPKPARRSSTLQRMELERQAERAKSDTERQRIQETIREQETQKAQARDQQILVAKRKDVERMLGLIKQRHEAGQLSKLQFEKMTEKKQAELADLDRRIRELESANGGS